LSGFRAQVDDEYLKDYLPGRPKTAKKYAYSSKPLTYAALPPLSYLPANAMPDAKSNGAYVVPLERFNSSLAPFSQNLVIDTPRVAFDSELPAIEEKMREISESRILSFMVSEPSLMSEFHAA